MHQAKFAPDNFVSILVETPASNETYKLGLCIKLNYGHGNFEFKGDVNQDCSKR